VAARDRRERHQQRTAHDGAQQVGDEGKVTFYGSSFISDPYGRVLVHAPRDEEAVLVADLDLDKRRDRLELFPFLLTRRPDTYAIDGAGRHCPTVRRGPRCDGGGQMTGHRLTRRRWSPRPTA
jgi:hypothetical protein